MLEILSFWPSRCNVLCWIFPLPITDHEAYGGRNDVIFQAESLEPVVRRFCKVCRPYLYRVKADTFPTRILDWYLLPDESTNRLICTNSLSVPRDSLPVGPGFSIYNVSLRSHESNRRCLSLGRFRRDDLRASPFGGHRKKIEVCPGRMEG